MAILEPKDLEDKDTAKMIIETITEKMTQMKMTDKNMESDIPLCQGPHCAWCVARPASGGCHYCHLPLCSSCQRTCCLCSGNFCHHHIDPVDHECHHFNDQTCVLGKQVDKELPKDKQPYRQYEDDEGALERNKS